MNTDVSHSFFLCFALVSLIMTLTYSCWTNESTGTNFFMLWKNKNSAQPRWALNFLQVGVCGPDFQSVGLANWYLPLKEGAYELKISKFGGLWATFWAKFETVEAKISKFSQKWVLWTDSFAWNGTLPNYRRGVKRGSSGLHIPIPPF